MKLTAGRAALHCHYDSTDLPRRHLDSDLCDASDTAQFLSLFSPLHYCIEGSDIHIRKTVYL